MLGWAGLVLVCSPPVPHWSRKRAESRVFKTLSSATGQIIFNGLREAPHDENTVWRQLGMHPLLTNAS